MAKTYISPSLLDAFCNSYDWIGMIKREEKEVSSAMQNGIEWEKAVIDGEFEELNSLIEGGLYQQMTYGKFDRFMPDQLDDFIECLINFNDIIKH